MKKSGQPLPTFGKVIFGVVCIFFFSGLLITACKKTDTRASSTEEIATAASLGKLKSVDIQTIADGFVSAIGVVASPDNTNRLFVIDQIGKIWIIDATGNKLATPFLDVSSMMVTLMPGYDERGLLGLAFHPNYSTNGKFYVFYTAPPRPGGPTATTTWNNTTTIAEFRVSSNANVADINSQRFLLQLNHPQFNHNGGTIAFGPDGYLYISIGDGGGADDVAPGHVEDWYAFNAGGNAQDIEANLMGNVLRIDVNGNPYNIPSDNPFVNKPGLDEIWAYGLRNPYRFSFDMGGSRRLFLGDAGQSRYEEVDIIEKGGNYGWNVKEGFECFNAAHDLEEVEECPTMDNFGNRLIDPVISINNAANPEGGRATTVIGGNVYRGHAIPGFMGKYIFGTFSQSFTTGDGELFIANPAGPAPWSFEEINLASHPNDIGYFLKGFGQDLQGEIYLAVSGRLGPSGTLGKVVKLIPAP
ncbi:MAG TPA: PQQ-dependent sugar dehydrogenase [Chitinophagaceae bacterium]|nr:PQQ-dependent sugar dehydrogenase [Chitinophagaceae bacterium]